jgi:hypothetical protein
VPPGEAPLWMREKWVGLKLPICGPAIPRIYRTVGVRPTSLLGLVFAVLRRRIPEDARLHGRWRGPRPLPLRK